MARRQNPFTSLIGCGAFLLVAGTFCSSCRPGGSSSSSSSTATAPARPIPTTPTPTPQERAEAAKIERQLLEKDRKEASEARAWQAQQSLQDTVHNAAAGERGQGQTQQYQGQYGNGYEGGSGDYPAGRVYGGERHVDPRGGVFHYSASGKKVYEKRR